MAKKSSVSKNRNILVLSLLGALCITSPALGAVNSAVKQASSYVIPYTAPYTKPYTAPYTKPYVKPHTPLYYQYGSRYGYYNPAMGFGVANYATLNRVVLQWNGDEKADRYLVFRSEGSPNYFKKISEVRYPYNCYYSSKSCVQKNYYNDTNVKAGTDYYYKMMYIAKDGRYSLTTRTVKAKTLPAVVAKPKVIAKPVIKPKVVAKPVAKPVVKPTTTTKK